MGKEWTFPADFVLDGKKNNHRMSLHNGFTLVELAVTLLVLSLILTLAIPSLRAMLQKNLMVSNVNSLVGALNLARTDSFKRSADVCICQRNGSDCLQGWRVISGADCSLDNGESELLLHGPLEGLSKMAGAAGRITHSGRGLPSTPMIFTLYDDRGTTEARAVRLNNAGQLRRSKKQADGSALDCS